MNEVEEGREWDVKADKNQLLCSISLELSPTSRQSMARGSHDDGGGRMYGLIKLFRKGVFMRTD